MPFLFTYFANAHPRQPRRLPVPGTIEYIAEKPEESENPRSEVEPWSGI